MYPQIITSKGVLEAGLFAMNDFDNNEKPKNLDDYRPHGGFFLRWLDLKRPGFTRNVFLWSRHMQMANTDAGPDVTMATFGRSIVDMWDLYQATLLSACVRAPTSCY
jgi:hypothetical protein